MGFTDADGEPSEVPEPPTSGSHYAQIGAFQRGDYHRNAFAQGTDQEAGVLADVLGLGPGDLLLDVGCGNGRHVTAFRSTGVRAIGLDLSPAVLGGGTGPLVAGDSGGLPFADGAFDAVISVCQGGFGLSLGHDERVMQEWGRVVRPGGRLALTAFSLVFAARYLGSGESLDLDRGLHHHLAEVRGPDGARQSFDLWTSAYSSSHLRHLVGQAGFDVQGTAGVEPGAYQYHRSPTITDPEILLWASRR